MSSVCWYDLFMKPLEKKHLKNIRKNLIKKANGKVLEIGSGTGTNFEFYKNNIITAIEPSKKFRNQSMKKFNKINVINGDAQCLVFPDSEFDTIVITLIMCTIKDPIKALNEIKRVCKPNGKILFLEHIRSQNKIVGKFEDFATPIWKKLAMGCHLNRKTVETIQNLNFKIINLEYFLKNNFVTIEIQNIK